MAEITATLVKELRTATNVSMMECKRALVDADGDMEKAKTLLRERGMAIATKKADRAANQGIIASASADGGRTASLVEVNCETDFVARNDSFKAFVANLAERACNTDEALANTLREDITAKVAEIGENLIVRRNTRFVLGGTGIVASYIHLDSKVGVLLEIGCEKVESVDHPVFKELAKDLTLHVAACSPPYLTSDEIPADVQASEREIFAKQVQDKPAQVVDKIVEGKLRKFFSEVCLLEQGFVKEPKQSVKQLLAEKGKEIDDSLEIRRFLRYQLGE